MRVLSAPRRWAKRVADCVVRGAVSHSATRVLLNYIYELLGPRAQEFAYTHFAKIFRNRDRQVAGGRWSVRFAGRALHLPIQSDRAWLDWDEAMSVLGHEVWIKQTYATLLGAEVRPDLFIDIGANYGTHSLLFLAHGVRALSFEPNCTCHEFFQQACALNEFSRNLHGVALGASRAKADLYFPERETWLGSTNIEAGNDFTGRSDIIHHEVDVLPLDDFESVISGRRILMKIDAEGFELAILRGAQRILNSRRPVILLEARSGHDNRELLEFVRAQNYVLALLPILDGRPLRVATNQEIAAARVDDVVAVPAELLSPEVLSDASTVFSGMRSPSEVGGSPDGEPGGELNVRA